MILNRHIILRSLRDNRVAILAFSLSMFVALFCYLGFFALVSSQSGQVGDILKHMPSWFFSNLQIDHETTRQTIENFLVGNIYGIIWPIITSIFVVYLATAAVAAEVEQGSMGLLLTLPLTRLQIIMSKYIAGLIALTFFVAASVIAVVPTVSAYGYSLHPSHFWSLSVSAWFTGWAIYSFAFMFSCLLARRAQVYWLAGGILTFMYLISGIEQTGTSPLRLFSLFSYYNPQSALIDGIVPSIAIFILSLIAIICTRIGIRRFLSRDFYI